MFQNFISNLTLRQRRIFVIAILAVGIAGLVILSIIAVSPKKLKPGDVVTKVDKNSGDKVSTIVGENETSTQNTQPAVLGLASLINLGMTTGQINAFKNSVAQYKKINSLGFTQASITTKSVAVTATGFRTADQTTIISAPLVLDSKQTITFKVQYKSSNDLEVVFYDGTKVLYDSGFMSL